MTTATDSSIIENLIHKFEKLGKTAKGIASSLRKLGIKGYKKCKYTCPGAVYMHMNLPDAHISVGSVIRITVGSLVAEYVTPNSILNFLMKFDAGFYPELEMRDE